ncbi:MAG: hypothetical protein JWL84_5780 [Rhodospirillales bacterium]|jgi:hypothetical protein|nr:hypothetical protein [Rhodospirillales bacterium]
MSSERKTRVEEHAYKIWEQEGRPHGRDKDHWHRAERDLADRPDMKPAPSASSVEATPDAADKAKRKASPKSVKEPKAATPRPAKTKGDTKAAKTTKPAKPKA